MPCKELQSYSMKRGKIKKLGDLPNYLLAFHMVNSVAYLKTNMS